MAETLPCKIKSFENDINLTREQVNYVKRLINGITSCRPIEVLGLEIKGKNMKSPSLINIVSISLKGLNGSIPAPEIEGYRDKEAKDFFYDNDNIFVLPTGKMILETTYKEGFGKGVKFNQRTLNNYFFQ